jgi:hypothetical protein
MVKRKSNTSPDRHKKAKILVPVTTIHMPCEILLLIFSYEDTLECIDNYSKVSTFWRYSAHQFDFALFQFDILTKTGLDYKYNVAPRYEFLWRKSKDPVFWKNRYYFLSTFRGCRGLTIPKMKSKVYDEIIEILARNPNMDKSSLKYIDFGNVNMEIKFEALVKFYDTFPTLQKVKIPQMDFLLAKVFEITDFVAYEYSRLPSLDFLLKMPNCRELVVRHSAVLYRFLGQYKEKLDHIESITIWEDSYGEVETRVPIELNVFDADVTTATLECLNRFKKLTIVNIQSTSIDEPLEFRMMTCKELTVDTLLFSTCKFDWETLKNLSELHVTVAGFSGLPSKSFEDFHSFSEYFGNYICRDRCLDIPERIRVTYPESCLYNDDKSLHFDIGAWEKGWISDLKLRAVPSEHIKPYWYQHLQHLSSLDLNDIAKLEMNNFMRWDGCNCCLQYFASQLCNLQNFRELCIFDQVYQEQLDNLRAEDPMFPYPPTLKSSDIKVVKVMLHPGKIEFVLDCYDDELKKSRRKFVCIDSIMEDHYRKFKFEVLRF